MEGETIMSSMREDALNNHAWIHRNSYPGRGLVIGFNEGVLHQLYWIMGRSENSRNRVFVTDNEGNVSTAPADASKVKDPSLIIYRAMGQYYNTHVVSNGDQTNTILDHFSLRQRTLSVAPAFQEALLGREYEPDAPNYTPRISGFCHFQDGFPMCGISIIRKTRAGCEHQNHIYQNMESGLGYCVTTYMGDGNPLPSFQGTPLLVPVARHQGEIAEFYWNALNPVNRVALVHKSIDAKGGGASANPQQI